LGIYTFVKKVKWKRSLKMLMECIKKSHLADVCKVIRLGIVNDVANVINDDVLEDPIFEIIYIGESSEYERPTLLHMRKKSEEENAKYFYLHTKGIQHFGKPNEPQIIDWINLMLYWNITKWDLAVEKLNIHGTYGCNDVGYHYSGNFWWATSEHIKRLPTTIAEYYTAPEDWVQLIRSNKYVVYNSGFQGMGHYANLFPREKYADCAPL
jgi:hypothetical protein